MNSYITILYGGQFKGRIDKVKKCQVSRSNLSSFPWLYSKISSENKIILEMPHFLFESVLPSIRNPFFQIHSSFEPALEYLRTGNYPENTFIAVNAGGKLFDIDKEFLISASPYFAALLIGGFSESFGDEIFIDVDPKGFKYIIDYLFYGSVVPLKYDYLIDYFNLNYKEDDPYKEITKSTNKYIVGEKKENFLDNLQICLPDDGLPDGQPPNITSGLIALACFRTKQGQTPPEKVRRLLNCHTNRNCTEIKQKASLYGRSTDGNTFLFNVPRCGDLLEKIKIHVTSSNDSVDRFWPYSIIEKITILNYDDVIITYDSLSLFILEETNFTIYRKKLEKEFRKRDKHATIILDFSDKLVLPIVSLPYLNLQIRIEWVDPEKIDSFLELDCALLHNEDREILYKSISHIKSTLYDSYTEIVTSEITRFRILRSCAITKIIIACYHEDPVSREWKFYRISNFKLTLNGNIFVNLSEKSLIMEMLERHDGDCPAGVVLSGGVPQYPVYEWAVRDIDSTIIDLNRIEHPVVEIEIPGSVYGADGVGKKILVGVQYVAYGIAKEGQAKFNRDGYV